MDLVAEVHSPPVPINGENSMPEEIEKGFNGRRAMEE
jgi:hypothetical protein